MVILGGFIGKCKEFVKWGWIMSEKWYVVNEQGEILREASPNERVISNGQSDYLLGTERIDFEFVKLNTKLIGDLGVLIKYVIELLPFISL